MAVEIVIPMLGVTVERGTIVEWLKREGERVEKGESLFVVETEKVTTEVEAPASGILAKIIVEVGVEVPVLTVVGLITESEEEALQEYKEETSSLPEDSSTCPPKQEPRSEKDVSSTGDVTIKAVPAARKFAKDHDIDLANISGTGPDGVIRYQDVSHAIADNEQTPVKASSLAKRLAAQHGVELERTQGTGVRGRIMQRDVQKVLTDKFDVDFGKVIPMNSMRQVIARRMSESAFTAPHISFFSNIMLDPLLEFRESILPDFEKMFNLRPSINDFLIKAVSLNILEFPMLNAQLKENEIHIMPEINVCLAVALPDGLIVPALKNTDRAGLVDLITQRQDLTKRAKSGNLTLDEIQRGTFTISSLAQFGITHFTAIINPPQSGILTVGQPRDELYLKEGQVKNRKIMTLGLSVDHRIIDGSLAADFLQKLKMKIEKPHITFLSI